MHAHTRFRFPVEIEIQPLERGERFILTVPDWPTIETQAETREDVIEQGRNVLDQGVAINLCNGQPLPQASSILHHDYIEISFTIQLKWVLVTAYRDLGLANWAIANKLKMPEWKVQQLVDPHHQSDTNEMVKALRVVYGRHVILAFL